MPAFCSGAKDLIAKLLVLDPAKRMTIDKMKNHPYFRFGLPDQYILPTPLPIASFFEPVDLSTVSEEVVDLLRKIGFNDDAQLAEELTSENHTMAKVFNHMLTSRLALDQLDWDRSVGTKETFGREEESFMMDAGNPFSGSFRYGSLNQGSYEPATSLASRPEWAIPETDSVPISETYDICASLDVLQTMIGLQRLVDRLDMQWFHPDEFMIIARHEAWGIYVVFQCQDTSNEEPQTQVQIQLCAGTADAFNTICHGAEEVLGSMHE